MSDPTAHDVIDAEQARKILEVPAEQIGVMVEEGMLNPIDDGHGGTGFARSEVVAVRMLGG